MNLLHAKKASISNIWSPTRRVKLQNTIKTVQAAATLRPRLVAQRIVQSRPAASLEDFSEELQSDIISAHFASTPTVLTTTPLAAETSGLWPLLVAHSSTTKMADSQSDSAESNVEVFDTTTTDATTTTEEAIIDPDIDFLQLIDELPEIDSTSIELQPSAEQHAFTDSTTEAETDTDASTSSRATTVPQLALAASFDDDDDDDPFLSSESVESLDTLVKAKRAIGNEQLVPKGNIVRPALVAKPKKPLTNMLQNETSAERAERVQKGIQRLMHFITIVGHVDSYLTKRFRTGVKKMARLYDSTEDAHRRPPRRRRRISF